MQRYEDEEAGSSSEEEVEQREGAEAHEERQDQRRCTASPVAVLQAQRDQWKVHWKATEARDDKADAYLLKKLDHLVQQQEEAAEEYRQGPEEDASEEVLERCKQRQQFLG